MKNKQTLQAILSLVALVCLLAGWFNFFSPEINEFLYQKIFFILIGISFILMAPTLSNRNFIYPMYLSAALCIIGALIPTDSRFDAVKTIGLLAGVVISIFNRPRIPRQQ